MLLISSVLSGQKYIALSFVRAGDTGGRGRGWHGLPTFLRSKKKKGRQREKERVSKQKLLKGCHQGQNIIVLTILERLEFQNFSYRPTMVADNTFQCSWPAHFEIHFVVPVCKTKRH